MIRQEIKRLFSNRLVPILIVVFVSVQCLQFFVYINSSDFKQYSQFFDQFTVNDSFDLIAYENYQINSVVYTDHDFRLAQKIDAVERSEKSVSETISKLESNLKSSLFADELIQKKMQAELKHYQSIQSSGYEIINDSFIEYSLDLLVQAAFVVIVCVVLVYYLFMQDIDNHFIELIQSIPQKTMFVFSVKMGILLCSLFVFISLQVMTTYFTYQLLNIDVSVLVSWVSGYSNVPFLVGIIEYLVIAKLYLFMGVVILSVILIVLILWTRNISFSVVVLILMMIGQYLMNVFVSINTALFPIKYINVYYMIFLPLNHFVQLELFNRFVEIHRVIFGTALFFIVMAGLVALLFYSTFIRKSQRTRDLGIISFKSLSLFWNLLFINGILRKCLAVLVVLCMYSIYQINDYTITKSLEQRSFETFQAKYLGIIDEDLMTRLREDLHSMALAEEEQKVLISKIQNDEMTADDFVRAEELQAILKDKKNLMTVNSDIELLVGQGATEYILTEGYTLLFHANSTLPFLVDFVMVAFAIVVITVIAVGNDFALDSAHVYVSTENGKNELLKKQLASISVFIFLVLVISNMTHFIKIQGNYGSLLSYNGLIRNILETDSTLTVYQFTLILLLNQWIFFVCVALFAYYMATKFTSLIAIALSSLVILALIFQFMVLSNNSLLSFIHFSYANNGGHTILSGIFCVAISLILFRKIRKEVYMTTI